MMVGLPDLDEAIGHDGTSNSEKSEPRGSSGGQATGIAQWREASWRGPILDCWHVVHRLHSIALVSI